MKTKLNLGCGPDYRRGWVNFDSNQGVRADVYGKMESMPLRDDCFDYVLTQHSLEHTEDFFKTMEEIWRVCKPGAIIEITVPHFTSIFAQKEPSHRFYFGIDSFRNLTLDPTCEQKYARARFKVLEEHLRLFYDSQFKPGKLKTVAVFFNHFNFLFNFNFFWQQFCERFWIFGFDEIYYKLEVEK